MTQVAGALAALLGYIARLVVGLVKVLPGLVGPALIVIGVSMFSIPAAVIVAGIALLLLDRRVP